MPLMSAATMPKAMTFDARPAAALSSSRHAALDRLRLLAFLAVVALHTITRQVAEPDALSILEYGTRFAVPVYFMLSGYFFESSRQALLPRSLRTLKRLAILFVCWEVLYFLTNQFLLPVSKLDMSLVKFFAWTVMDGGVAWHLWFLPSLAACVVAFTILRPLGFSVVLGAAAVLYAFGLMLGTWNELTGAREVVFAHLGLHGFNMRNGPFFGMIFFAIGARLKDHIPECPTYVLVSAMLCGFLLQIGEAGAVTRNTDGDFAPHDYLLSTILFSVPIFLIFCRQTILDGMSSQFGRLALGAYCIHVFVLELLRTPASPFFIGGSAANLTDYPELLLIFLLVSALSILLSVLLSKIPGLRTLVR